MSSPGPTPQPPSLVCPVRRIPADRFVVAPTGEVLACADCAALRGLTGAPFALAEWEASDAARAALAAYGLPDPEVARPPQGEWRLPQSRVWEVRAAGATYILKRCPPWQAFDALRHEHSVLAHLARLGLPVAAPLRGPRGTSVELADGTRWVLYPAIAGEPAPPSLWLFRATPAAGKLAALHRALEDCVPEGAPHPEGAPTPERLDAALARWPELPGGAADLVAQARDWLADRYFGGYAQLPHTLIHGDFGIASLLWSGEQLNGYVGFARAHPDSVLHDFGLGLWTQHPPLLRARVTVYLKARPLTMPEREALPEACLLGALMALDAHLAFSREPGETARLVDALAHTLGNLDALRRAATR
jgi:Ser/Thr protein kinase RdoA (MazF antagonist)